MSDAFLCPACGFEDLGRYCSKCGAELWLPPAQVVTMARKRLELHGFIDIKAEGKSKLPADLVDLLLPLNRLLSIVMVTDQTVMSNRVLQVLALTRYSEITDPVLQAVDRFYDSFVTGLRALRSGRVSNTELSIVTFLDRKPSPSDLERLRRASRKKISLGRTVSMKVVPVDVEARTVGISRMDPIRGPLMLSLRQVRARDGGTVDPHSAPSSIVGEAIRVVSEPFSRFLTGLKTVVQPASLARQIELNRLKSGDLIAYLLAVSVLSTLIGALGGVETEYVGVPLVDDLIDLGLFIGFGLACAIPAHYMLRLCGGKGSLGNCFLATTFASATAAPVFSIVNVIASFSNGDLSDLSKFSTPIQVIVTSYWASVLAVLYGTRYFKTLIICFLATIPAGVALVPIIIAAG